MEEEESRAEPGQAASALTWVRPHVPLRAMDPQVALAAVPSGLMTPPPPILPAPTVTGLLGLATTVGAADPQTHKTL